MTSAWEVADLVVEALIAKDVAGGNCFGYRDWPTTEHELPIVLLEMPTEQKISEGRGSAQAFTSVVTIELGARVKAPAQAADGGAAAVEAALALMQRAIERAVINSPAITAVIQHIPFIRTKTSGGPGEASPHVGELRMAIGFEVYQPSEDFYEPEPEDLEEVHIVVDLVKPADLAGTYDAPAEPSYPVEAAPRASGPDGRKEGELLIQLPVLEAEPEPEPEP